MEMYNRVSRKPPMEDSELIDISSDDSNDGLLPFPPPPGEKTTNGASTSQKNKVIYPVPPLFANATKGNKPPKDKELAVDEELAPPLLPVERSKKRKSETQGAPLLRSALKRAKSVATLQDSSVTFKDLGGMDPVLEHLCKLLVHVKHPEVYRQIGITSPRGFLLHGPPGCGKTLLANAIAGVSIINF